MSNSLAEATSPSPESVDQEIEALAKRYASASGFLMKGVTYIGGRAENILERLPDQAKDMLEDGVKLALNNVYSATSAISDISSLPEMGSWARKASVAFSGFAGGFGGLPTTVAELPLSIAMMFRAIQKVAEAHGFDPSNEFVKLECLKVFASGGPLSEDDGVDTSFIASRFVLRGAAVHGVISSIAPRLTVLMGQKLASQSVPVLGGVAGAAVNYAFISYFEEMAQVRFGLLKIVGAIGDEETKHRFQKAFTDLDRKKLAVA